MCAICKNPVGTGVPSSTLTEKGSSTINQASNARKDSIQTMPGEKVHQDCRRKYCNPYQIAKDTNQEESMPSTSSGRPVLRSSEEGFSFKTDCFFCGRPAKFGRKRKYDVLQVKTIGLKDTILKICHKRADSWSDTGRHAFCMCMTCMQQMQFTTRLAVLISAQRSRCQWLS